MRFTKGTYHKSKRVSTSLQDGVSADDGGSGRDDAHGRLGTGGTPGLPGSDEHPPESEKQLAAIPGTAAERGALNDRDGSTPLRESTIAGPNDTAANDTATNNVQADVKARQT